MEETREREVQVSDLRPMVDEGTCQARKAEEDMLQGEANGSLESVSCLRLTLSVTGSGGLSAGEVSQGQKKGAGHTEHQDINI